jgi:hypothetical protein
LAGGRQNVLRGSQRANDHGLDVLWSSGRIIYVSEVLVALEFICVQAQARVAISTRVLGLNGVGQRDLLLIGLMACVPRGEMSIRVGAGAHVAREVAVTAHENVQFGKPRDYFGAYLSIVELLLHENGDTVGEALIDEVVAVVNLRPLTAVTISS